MHCLRGYYATRFGVAVFVLFASVACKNFKHVMFVNMVAAGLCGLALNIYEFDIKIAPQLRVLEIISKVLCQYVIIVTIVFIIMSFSLRRFIIITCTIFYNIH